MRPFRRFRRAVPVVGSILVLFLATSPTSASGFSTPRSMIPRVDDTPRPAEWEEAITVLKNTYGLDDETARRRVADQTSRLQFRESAAEALGDLFAGFRFDMQSGVQEVFVTDTEEAGPVVTEVGARFGVETVVREAERSYQDLETLVRRAEAGELGIAQDDVLHAVLDDNRNVVVVHVAEERLPTLREAVKTPGIELAPFVPDGAVDEVCTGHYSCGGPLRGGIGVWRGSAATYVCSLGHSATGNDGSRWAITAGHCVTVQDQLFGHGGQYFGPARQFINNPAGSYSGVDVARIRIDNAYWHQWESAGRLINITPNSTVAETPKELTWALRSRSSIDVGDVYCLAALSPTFGDACGAVSQEYTHNGAVRVGNYDACPGDSGGAWVWNSGSGYWGIGVHEGGASGCPKESGDANSSQGFSDFTAIPDITTYWDANSVATIRIDE